MYGLGLGIVDGFCTGEEMTIWDSVPGLGLGMGEGCCL